MIRKRTSISEENNVAYKSIALNFPSDYDKENPLTKSAGIERLHKIHIDLLKAEGKEDEAKDL